MFDIGKHTTFVNNYEEANEYFCVKNQNNLNVSTNCNCLDELKNYFYANKICIFIQEVKTIKKEKNASNETCCIRIWESPVYFNYWFEKEFDDPIISIDFYCVNNSSEQYVKIEFINLDNEIKDILNNFNNNHIINYAKQLFESDETMSNKTKKINKSNKTTLIKNNQTNNQTNNIPKKISLFLTVISNIKLKAKQSKQSKQTKIKFIVNNNNELSFWTKIGFNINKSNYMHNKFIEVEYLIK